MALRATVAGRRAVAVDDVIDAGSATQGSLRELEVSWNPWPAGRCPLFEAGIPLSDP